MEQTDVLIVGGGPVGLSAAVLLGRLGVPYVLVERRDGTSTHPKATVVNTRTVELLRQWGLEDRVRARGLPAERSLSVSWFTRLDGHHIGSLPMIDLDPVDFARRLSLSPTLPMVCAQSELEQELLAAAREAGGDLRFGNALDSFAASADAVDCTLADGTVVCARYLLAADGPQSPVRRALGITNDGFDDLGQMVNIHFAADLSRWTDVLPSLLYWIVNHDLRGVIHALDGRERWLLNVIAEPGAAVLEIDAERALELVRAATGDAELPAEILSIKPWTLEATVAEHYRDGRVLLAGDAVHQFPPTGGFGMNTGIQDVHNLAWKLAAVLRGEAPETLLDSYETERRGVGMANCEQSVLNAARMVSTGLFFDSEDTYAQRVEADDDEGAALRAELAESIPEQREHFVFDGQDLGFIYAGASIVPDDSEPPRPDNPIMDYIPSAHPGARAPHLWLERDGAECSTLDLFTGAPVLLTGSSGGAWRAAEGVTVIVTGPVGDVQDPGDALCELYGIGPDGAVLVRPDGHVAARFASATGDPAATVAQALAQCAMAAPAALAR